MKLRKRKARNKEAEGRRKEGGTDYKTSKLLLRRSRNVSL
jgi:hypothetical protein